jgi:hypothetical protein
MFFQEWRRQVTQLDLQAETTEVISSDASGTLTLDTPDSRAVLTHVRRIDERSSN